MTDELKRAIYEAFGVTEEEVDSLDRALFGPEVRAARAEGERRVFAEVEAALRSVSEMLPDGVELVWGEQVVTNLAPGDVGR